MTNDNIEEKLERDLMNTVEEMIKTIINTSGCDNRLVLSMLVNTTINTLSYNNMCMKCYIASLTNTVNEVQQGNDLEHFDFSQITTSLEQSKPH